MVLKLFWPFEGNREADVVPGENEFDTPGLKKPIIKMKRETTVWENIFTKDTSDKGLISKIYKELI